MKSGFPDYLDLQPAARARGTVTLPGSKSISNRTLLLAALAQGTTQIMDLLASDDTLVMLLALQKLGVQWQQVDATRQYTVQGVDGVFPVHQADLFMGNAGTAIRPLTAALAVLGGDYTLHGVARMHERPIGDLVDALNAAGARIDYTGVAGYPPLHIRRGQVDGQRLRVRGNVSSQFLTALLMAAPLLAKTRAATVEVVGELISKPYIEITLNLMRRFGVAVERDGWQAFTVAAGQRYRSPGVIHVEGDASSASYFLAAGAIAGGPVRVEGVGANSIQGDVRFVEALRQMGATVRLGENWIEAESNGALQGDRRRFQPHSGCRHDDCRGSAVCRRSQRIAQHRQLARQGNRPHRGDGDRIAQAWRRASRKGADYLRITPPPTILAASIDTYDDHRMAMCFSLATLDGAARKGAALRINDPGCVAKTFPEYFNAFAQICRREPA